MLREVSLELARRGYVVSVVARGIERLARLMREAEGRINPVAVNYRDSEALNRALEKIVHQYGTIALAVVWTHRIAPDAPLTVARFVQGRFFHVLGSTAANPAQDESGRRRDFEGVPGLVYHEIVLGFCREPSGSRWLTDREISQGVIDAIDTQYVRQIVGEIAPWSDRPFALTD